MEHTNRPRAGIVGAGIAGLSAAIALRRAGWQVEVFEKSTFKHEVGAAITVPPSATLALTRWGFDFKKGGAVQNISRRFIFGDTLEVLSNEQYPDIEKEFGAPSLTIHRVDLHQGLRDLAVDPDYTKGIPVKLRLGSRVVDVVPDTRKIYLEDGTSIENDLVIAADGSHSKSIKQINPNAKELEPTGRSCYRCLVPTHRLKNNPELWSFFANETSGFIGFMTQAPKTQFIAYACRNGEIMNYAIVHDTKKGEGEEDLWNAPASKEKVLKELATFHPRVQKLMDVVYDEDKIAVYHLWKREPLESFVNGCCALVGDAAHVMLPTHAAGGAMAIESGATLEPLFSGIAAGDHATIEHRLQIFDKLRIPRGNLAMILSNAGPFSLQDPEVEKQVRRFYSGPLPASEESLTWGKPMRKLLFHYNAFEVAEEALREDQNKSGMQATE